MILLTDKINTSQKGGDGGFAISIGSGVYIDAEYLGRIYGRAFVQCGNCTHWNAETHGRVRNPILEPWYENDYCSYGEVTVDPRDRNCDTCWVAQNYNLEDDDSPCQNCEVKE